MFTSRAVNYHLFRKFRPQRRCPKRFKATIANHDDKTITFGPNEEVCPSDSRLTNPMPVDPRSDAAGSDMVESSSELMVAKVSEILAIMQA